MAVARCAIILISNAPIDLCGRAVDWWGRLLGNVAANAFVLRRDRMAGELTDFVLWATLSRQPERSRSAEHLPETLPISRSEVG
ncbi:MAG: hypothetical protein CMJ59_25240 [Planctomycetaceae bacterium]|nr:hypothetical protein [Planctomycetaceae bacterium]